MLQQQLSQVFLQSFHNWPIYLQVCTLHRCFQHWSQNTLLYLSEQAVLYLYCSCFADIFCNACFLYLSFFPFLFQEKSTVEDIHKEVCVALEETFFCPSVIVYSYFFYPFIICTCKLVLELEICHFESKYVIHVNRVDLVCVCGGRGVWLDCKLNKPHKSLMG